MIRPIFKGRASKGKFKFYDRAAFDNLVRALGDCEIEITIQRATKRRSNQQNSFYRAVIVQTLSEFTGAELEETHHDLRRRFIHGRSTASLTTTEFNRFIEDCQRHGDSLGCRIPDPGEVEWDFELTA